MTRWQQSIGRMLSHWKLAWTPLGFLAILYGNSLYETSQHRLGMALFFGGWFAAIGGTPAWKRFLEEDPIREGNQKVAWLAILLLVFLLQAFIPAVKFVRGESQPGDLRAAATSLGLIYLVVPLAVRWAEPRDHFLQRLPTRIGRAAIFRAVANGAGICAVAAILSERFVVTYPAPLISTFLTLMVAMAVVTHKTFARVRKLCTQTHVDVQNLLRDMEELRRDSAASRPSNWLQRSRTGQLVSDKHAEKQMAVRRSWDAVKLDLRTTVDSGYRPFGLPFLAEDAIDDLEKKVSDAVEAADFETIEVARADLRAILDACARRIDVLA
jgi:hypothetical protein